MKPGSKPLLLLLGVLLTAQVAQYRGCEWPGPGPGPTPVPVPPVPPPVPIASEGLHLVLVHETGDTTPQLASLKVQLRNGAAAEYLKTNKHVLDILDDDTLPPALKTAIGEVREIPTAFFIDRKTDKLLGSMPVVADTTADSILAKVKEYSGAN